MATKSSKNDECVRVMVRIRPMSGKEVQDGRQEVTTANFDRAEVSILNPVASSSEPPKSFTFDAAFGAKSTQQQVYDTAATEIVEAVMEGYNGTIFAIEEAQAIAEKAQREKEEMLQKTRDDLALAAKDKAQAELNKRELELKLERERQQAEELALQQKVLLDRLAATQAKVLIGGEMMTKAAQQENELRRTKLELEERKRQELQLARELAEQEESNLMREEKYQSLQEEAEAKARKLKKVYTKVKEVLGDIKAMEKAHSREREDLLDTIRQLTAQLKLKSLVLDYFMPMEAVAMLEARARWDDEEDDFTLDRLELAGNTLRPRQRPPSASSVRRPETSSDKSRAGKKFVLAQNDDEDDEIARAEELELTRNPFFMYVSDNEGDGYAPAASRKKQAPSSGRPKTAKKSSKSSSKRPETASRRRSEKK
ncbi:hypothetical protein C6341_g7797 [Phytophthora cactorum]|uniref:Kinesin motor domain-containing protein n=1 Tax=Phytophthora cactorum TaxID=29920 RepID=A0A8T1E2H2_9STRA|nr:hypothetical protein PC117_g7072 [Phytophthora cactorum]KAG3178868.1 hypothetical protein C6341_g7797 [Phytophthora cactorum]